MRTIDQHPTLYTVAMICVGAALTLIILTVGSGHFAHAQGHGGGPGAGHGTAGIPAVLAQIDVVQHHLHDIEDTVTRRAFDMSVTVCFDIGGKISGKYEGTLGVDGKISGMVGADIYGNGIKLEIEPNAGGKLGLGIEGGIGTSVAFCIDFPIPRGPLEDAQQHLAEAIQGVAENVRHEVTDILASIGFTPDTIETKVLTATDLISNFPPTGDDIMFMLADGPSSLGDLIEILPVNVAIKDQINFSGNLLPTSLAELNMCDPNFALPIPAFIQPLQTQICSLAQEGLNLANAINNIRSIVQSIQNTVNNILNKLDDLFCDAFPNAPGC